MDMYLGCALPDQAAATVVNQGMKLRLIFGFLAPHCGSRALPVTGTGTAPGRGELTVGEMGVTPVTFPEQQKWALLVSRAILGICLWSWSIQCTLLHKIIMKSEEMYRLDLIYFFVYTEWALLGFLIPVILLLLDAGSDK